MATGSDRFEWAYIEKPRSGSAYEVSQHTSAGPALVSKSGVHITCTHIAFTGEHWLEPSLLVEDQVHGGPDLVGYRWLETPRCPNVCDLLQHTQRCSSVWLLSLVGRACWTTLYGMGCCMQPHTQTPDASQDRSVCEYQNASQDGSRQVTI